MGATATCAVTFDFLSYERRAAAGPVPTQRPQMKKTPAVWARLGSCYATPGAWELGVCKRLYL